jgi:creatinine amidohydrolase/Fe(II)-dependent formamide hydrolase-like protein
MRRSLLVLTGVALCSLTAVRAADAQNRGRAERRAAGAMRQAMRGAPVTGAETRLARGENVEFGMMTWPEVKAALAGGKTTALFYTGGTEQRGPQNVNGGHNLMGRSIVREIARQLGDALAMPVLPFTPNNASAELTGTIGLTPELLGAVLERVVEQAIATGFKNVVIMGDHGGGQPATYADVAKKLDAKYAAQGIHVYYCDEVYTKATADLDEWLKAQGLPTGGHASLIDTSTMLYLGGSEWVRLEELPNAEGDPVLPRGQRPDPSTPRKNNGITGDGRKSSAEIGKKAFDLRVEYALRQIRQLTGR